MNSIHNWVVVSNTEFFVFTPILGKISFLTKIFQMGWFNHQPDNKIGPNGRVHFLSSESAFFFSPGWVA